MGTQMYSGTPGSTRAHARLQSPAPSWEREPQISARAQAHTHKHNHACPPARARARTRFGSTFSVPPTFASVCVRLCMRAFRARVRVFVQFYRKVLWGLCVFIVCA